MEKEVKIQFSKSNQRIDIPAMWLEILRAEKGDKVKLELDIKKNQIVVKFNKK